MLCGRQLERSGIEWFVLSSVSVLDKTFYSCGGPLHKAVIVGTDELCMLEKPSLVTRCYIRETCNELVFHLGYGVGKAPLLNRF